MPGLLIPRVRCALRTGGNSRTGENHDIGEGYDDRASVRGALRPGEKVHVSVSSFPWARVRCALRIGGNKAFGAALRQVVRVRCVLARRWERSREQLLSAFARVLI